MWKWKQTVLKLIQEQKEGGMKATDLSVLTAQQKKNSHYLKDQNTFWVHNEMFMKLGCIEYFS